MTLITCAECAATISNKASACPNCGAPQSRPREKYSKLPAWLWVPGLLAVGFVLLSAIGALRTDSEKDRKAAAVALCWQEQGRKSRDADSARAIAAACEQMEAEYAQRYGRKP